ncbi:hypothetical protein SCB49_13605 [unidentified eubacterium SCB49]|nr:hypothetical protein SCB49_13605 [unidentified eubacterium SCB49]
MINYIASVGVNIWGLNELQQINDRYEQSDISYEEYVAQQHYDEYYQPKIDSLLEANPKAAINYIDKVISKYPKEYFLELQKGVAYYKIDSFETANIQFKKSMDKNGREFPRALGYSGWALAELGRYDEAIIELKKAAEVNSDYIVDMAMVYEMKNDIPNAIKYYQLEIENMKNLNALRYYKDIEYLTKKVAELKKS